MHRLSTRQLFLLLPLALVLGVCSDDESASSSGPDTGGAGTGGDAAGGAGGSGPTLTVDVVVLGAGSGGIAAAIAAARLGASVVLVEQTDWIGGQMTAAAVANMDGGDQLPTDSGLYAEFKDRVHAYYDDPVRFPPSGKAVGTCYWSNLTTCFEPKVGRELLQQMLDETSVTLMLRQRAVSVSREGQTVTGVTLEDGTAIDAHVVIDATEAGDVLPLAGVRYRVGNTTSDALDPDACIQSLTYLAVIRKYPGAVPDELRVDEKPPGYDEFHPSYASVVAATGSNGFPLVYPVSFAIHNAYRGLPDSTNPESYTGIDGSLITRTGVNWANDYPGWHFDSMQEPVWVDTLKIGYLEDEAMRREVDCQAKLMTIGFVHYVQTELGHPDWSVADDEGFDSPYNVEDNDCASIPAELKAIERHLPPMPYIRESRRIVPVDTLTAAEIERVDAIAVNNFTDSIAVGDYPTDLHNCNSDAELESDLGETAADNSAHGPFQVPITALIPEEVDGFLAAEKNIGVTRLAAGAIRLQPITMLTGQAAGIMAALAARDGVAPRALRTVDVQRVLLDEGSSLSRFVYADVPTDSEWWKAVQLVSTHEIMVGTSPTTFLPDASATRAQAAVVLARLFGLDTSSPPATPTYDDVPASHFAFAAIEAITEEQWTSGCSAAPPLFCPDSPITRAQLAVFAVRGLGLDPMAAPSDPLFNDVPATHPFFAYIQLAAQEGILGGCAPDVFCPDTAATRGVLAGAGYAVLIR